jgi:hypothetical protein
MLQVSNEPTQSLLECFTLDKLHRIWNRFVDSNGFALSVSDFPRALSRLADGGVGYGVVSSGRILRSFFFSSVRTMVSWTLSLAVNEFRCSPLQRLFCLQLETVPTLFRYLDHSLTDTVLDVRRLSGGSD